jgi:predicted nuclease of predicted toxin-antitoxin system
MLLLDQNLSDKIIPELQDAFPGSVHVKLIGLDRKADAEIWQYALDQRLTIVTNDDDFETLAEYRGFPPKVIHLVRGNLSRLEMLKILTGNAALLKAFINSKTDGYLALA